MQKKKLLKLKSLNNRKNILLVGLGNPGEKYSKTRHNAGFAVIDYLSEKKQINLKKAFFKPYLYAQFVVNKTTVTIVKPLTYMNLSGNIFPTIIKRFSISTNSIYVICDNMDLQTGKIRIKSGGSSAGHNGLKSIIDCTGETNFNRIYVGVGRPVNGLSIIEHVLGRFDEREQYLFDAAVVEAGEALISVTSKSLSKVMNETNRRNH